MIISILDDKKIENSNDIRVLTEKNMVHILAELNIQSVDNYLILYSIYSETNNHIALSIRRVEELLYLEYYSVIGKNTYSYFSDTINSEEFDVLIGFTQNEIVLRIKQGEYLKEVSVEKLANRDGSPAVLCPDGSSVFIGEIEVVVPSSFIETTGEVASCYTKEGRMVFAEKDSTIKIKKDFGDATYFRTYPKSNIQILSVEDDFVEIKVNEDSYFSEMYYGNLENEEIIYTKRERKLSKFKYPFHSKSDSLEFEFESIGDFRIKFSDEIELIGDDKEISFGSQKINNTGTFTIGKENSDILIDSKLEYVEIIDFNEFSLFNIKTEDSEIKFKDGVREIDGTLIGLTFRPKYGSPILVERGGESLRKVSFFNYYTGEYLTYNEELAHYHKEKDYIEISYLEKDIDLDGFELTVRDQDGNSVGSNIRLKGRRVYLNLTDIEKEHYHNEYFYVMYQLTDSYTITTNIGVPDSFEIKLANLTDEKIEVIYEGERKNKTRLLTEVDMNPAKSTNTSGFLYVLGEEQELVDIEIESEYDEIYADGKERMLISAIPRDKYGNFISHIDMGWKSNHGKIVPIYESFALREVEQAGRFLFHYYPTRLKEKDIGLRSIREKISFFDKETKIGGGKVISLVAEGHSVFQIDGSLSLFDISRIVNQSAEDIAKENNMTVLELNSKIRKREVESISLLPEYVNQSKSYDVDTEIDNSEKLRELFFAILNGEDDEKYDLDMNGIVDIRDLVLLEKSLKKYI